MRLICKRALLLVGVCMLAGGVSLWAQQSVVQYVLSTVPTTVGSTGDAEVLGSLHFQVSSVTISTPAPTSGTVLQQAIQIQIPSVSCDNNSFSGMQITFGGSGVFHNTTATPSVYFGTPDVSNSVLPNTCVVAINVVLPFSAALGTNDGLPVVGDWFQLDGIRGRMEFSTVPVGGPINATVIIQSSVGSGEIVGSNTLQVATPNPVLSATVNDGVYVNCENSSIPTGSIVVTEPYSADFVDFATPDVSSAVLTTRPLFGATAPGGTEILLTVNNVPAGVTLAFPPLVPGSVPAPAGAPVIAQGAGDHLQLVSTLTGNGTITGPVTSAQVLYAYTCYLATACDTTYESFTVVPVVTGTGLNTTGVITAQVQVVPYDVTASTPVGGVPAFTTGPNTPPYTVRPRWSDAPMPSPAQPLVTLAPCSTSLLFPWVVSIPGYDTGVVINNTTQDYTNASALPSSVLIASPNYPMVTPTNPEAGTCTLYYFPSNEAPALYYTTPSISTGESWAAMMSTSPFNGLTGYMMARCNFQFGHGYATIGQGSSSGSLTFSEAYIPLVIPDPVILGGRADYNAAALFIAPLGESLDQ